MATEKKFLSLTGLTEYTENVMTEIAEGDSNTLASAKSYTDSVVEGKANASHTHDDRYYTETEIDSKLSAINGAISDIEDGTTVVPKATHAVNADSATSATSATKAEQDDSGDIISEKYETKSDANSKLEAAKTYADNAAATVKNDLLNGAGAAYDTLKELGDLIDDNQDAIEALETVAAGKADSVHSHAITDVTGLQTALDNKADASHGTHVTFDSTNKPKMDGTAAFGTSTSVARADHVHPTDTSRAAKTDLDSHTGNTTIHITSAERTKWNTASTTATAAKTAADAAQATADSKADAGHTHSAATTSSAGFMTAEMVTKLNGIVTDSALSTTSTNPLQNKVITSNINTLSEAIQLNANGIQTNTNSIDTNAQAIAGIQEELDAIEEITSAEIQALFAS